MDHHSFNNYHKTILPIEVTEGTYRKIVGPQLNNCVFLRDVWEQKRSNNSIPRRIDIQAKDIIPILPYFYLLESINNGNNFIVRLVGTGCVDLFDTDPTQKKLTELKHTGIDVRINAYKATLEDSIPHHGIWEATNISPSKYSKQEHIVEICMVPLLNKNNRQTLIGCSIDICKRE